MRENIADPLRGGSRIRRVNAGASTGAGVLSLDVSAKDQSNSFLEYSRIKNDAVRKIEVLVRTPNEIRSSLALPVPEMLKVDAEALT